jgi:hypothetical protein
MPYGLIFIAALVVCALSISVMNDHQSPRTGGQDTQIAAPVRP